MKVLFTILSVLIAVVCYSQANLPAFTIDCSTTLQLKEKSYLTDGKIGELHINVRPMYVYKTSSGQMYVHIYDNKGEQHRRYLGYPVNGTYEGSTIFTNKDKTKYWFFQLGRYNQPYKVVLPNWVVTIG